LSNPNPTNTTKRGKCSEGRWWAQGGTGEKSRPLATKKKGLRHRSLNRKEILGSPGKKKTTKKGKSRQRNGYSGDAGGGKLYQPFAIHRRVKGKREG